MFNQIHLLCACVLEYVMDHTLQKQRFQNIPSEWLEGGDNRNTEGWENLRQRGGGWET